ncbi:MAG: putative importin alpha protein, partial [Streblomastix strix]
MMSLGSLDREKRRALRFKEAESSADAKELRNARENESVILRAEKRQQFLGKRRRFNTDDAHPTITEFNKNSFASLAAGLSYSDQNQQLSALVSLRKVTSQNEQQNDVQDLFVEFGLIENLSHLLDNNNTNIEEEALWCLTNVAAGSSQCVRAVAYSTAIEKIVAYVASPNPKLCSQALWCLANICADSDEIKEYVNQFGIYHQLEGLLSSLDQLSSNVLGNAVFLLSNLIWNGTDQKTIISFSQPILRIFSVLNIDLERDLLIGIDSIPIIEKFSGKSEDFAK